MTRQEFTFAIGFQGDTAIVDKRAMRQHGKLTTMGLAESGLYRAAFCSALFSGDSGEMDEFIRVFAAKASGGPDRPTADGLKRLFGVYTVPDEIKRVVSL
jgi:hypothetical protein